MRPRARALDHALPAVWSWTLSRVKHEKELPLAHVDMSMALLTTLYWLCLCCCSWAGFARRSACSNTPYFLSMSLISFPNPFGTGLEAYACMVLAVFPGSQCMV